MRTVVKMGAQIARPTVDGVAGIPAHQVGEWDIDGGRSPVEGGIHRIGSEPGAIVKWPGTGLALCAR
jgi:hypothetical protein